MDVNTLIAAMDLSRNRLMDELATIEKTAPDAAAVLAWRPGPGRAHIGWQFTHCAATHEKFLKRFLNEPADEKLLADFAANSVPSDTNIPTTKAIRDLLSGKYEALRTWLSAQTPQSIARMVPAAGGKQRSVADTMLVLIWHEAHHQGQIHLTWNLYKAAHGLT
jgi:uncharacterized damage-inducible protein DinB